MTIEVGEDYYFEPSDDYEQCRDYMCDKGTLPDLLSECRMGRAVRERSPRLAVLYVERSLPWIRFRA